MNAFISPISPKLTPYMKLDQKKSEFILIETALVNFPPLTFLELGTPKSTKAPPVDSMKNEKILLVMTPD